MSRDKRLNRTQEVDGSSPFSSTKVNDFRSNNLASRPNPAFPTFGRECLVPRLVRIANRFRSIHILRSTMRRNFVQRATMDLTNRISRSEIAEQLGVQTQTIAK